MRLCIAAVVRCSVGEDKVVHSHAFNHARLSSVLFPFCFGRSSTLRRWRCRTTGMTSSWPLPAALMWSSSAHALSLVGTGRFGGHWSE